MILQKCTKNYDHKIYGCGNMAWDGRTEGRKARWKKMTCRGECLNTAAICEKKVNLIQRQAYLTIYEKP